MGNICEAFHCCTDNDDEHGPTAENITLYVKEHDKRFAEFIKSTDDYYFYYSDEDEDF